MARVLLLLISLGLSAWCGRQEARRVGRSPEGGTRQRTDAVLDTINIRYFAYGGMPRSQVDLVYPLPVAITADTAWVKVVAGPYAYTEVRVERREGRWVRTDAIGTVRF
jgi:hypothetical protein